ncbi:MAG: hypothetical protein ACXVLF_15165 [Flavisolibacter sp.]
MLFVASLLVLFSCRDKPSRESTEFKNRSKPSFRFYYRDVGCNNGVCSYADFVILENYENDFYTVRQLANIAIRYLDTAKASLPITRVTIIGEPFGVTLPPGMTNRYYEHADYQVVSFVFPELAPGYPHTAEGIESISIWKKGEAESFDAVDSLLASKGLINNEN